VFGLVQLDDIRKDVLPEFSPVTVEVQTEALGLSAAEMERLITIPLEQDLLSGVAFLESIESASLPGLSSVVMTFEPGTDLLDARQVVSERLAQAAGLPQVSDPPQMIQPLSSTGRVAMVSLSSDELTPIETSVLARWIVLPRLLGVNGVANVSIFGFRDRQLQVLVDPARLDAQDVTLGEVIRTAGNALEVSPLTYLEASSPGTGGFIDTVNQRLHVFHEQAISTPEELALVTIEGEEGEAVYVDGRPLTLGEVAEIVTDHQPLIGDARCNSGRCVLLVIEKFPEANTPEVTRDIDEALRALGPGLPGIEFDSSLYRPASYVTSSFNNLGWVLLVGAALLLLAMWLFLRNWRLVLIGAVSVVVSLTAAGVVLYVAGATVNVMILAGFVMALVAIVDDALVGAWGQSTGSRAPGTGAGLLWSIRDAVLRTRGPVLYGAVVAGAAALTFFFLEGEGGAFLPHIGSAYLLALAIGLLSSLTVTPALGALLLRQESGAPIRSSLMESIQSVYRRRAPRLVGRPGPALVAFSVFVASGLVALLFIGSSLRPDLKERDVVVSIAAAAGTSLERMDQIAAEIVFAVDSLEGVSNTAAHVGRAITSDQVVNVNSAEVWAKIDVDADYESTLEDIKATVTAHQSIDATVETYSSQRVTEILGRSAEELVVRVYGDNTPVLRQTAEMVAASVEGAAGVSDARLDLPLEESTIEVDIDLERAQERALKPGDVRRRAATLLSGIVVGNLFEEQKVFDVVVWGAPAIRQTVDDVRDMLIPTPSGENVTLADIAEVRVVPNQTVIRHESVEPYIDVKMGVVDRDLADVAADIDGMLAGISFPLEYHAEVLGGFSVEREANSRVIAVVVTALIGMFVFLQAAFSSWRLALLVFATLPMAVSGGILAVLITDREVTLGSIAGLVAVVGLAARETVLLVRNYEARERQGKSFGESLIVEGTTEMLLPTLAPVAALAAVFLPLAIASGISGLEIVGPMAVVVLGGLVATLLLTLLVVPAFYLRWGFIEEPDTTGYDLFERDHPEALLEGG
jgi:Cu/Ag efflux pump CusA